MDRLVAAALEARKRAYAPYSGYRVGAAILTRSGKLYLGCNVENASYGATICAERTAVARMVADGEQEPVACAVATGGKSPGTPFARDMPIALVAGKVRRDTSLARLLPDAFRLKSR
jgi:cytidine deaminase